MKEKQTSVSPRAVALRYQPHHDQAPRVTAKGTGKRAEQIIQLAEEHGIPIEQDPSLVAILSQLEVNQQIPEELYQVVAEILAFVYRTDRQEGEDRGSTSGDRAARGSIGESLSTTKRLDDS